MSEDRWVWVPFEVDKKFDGYRMDRFLTERLTGYSRTRIQKILESARVLKENRPAKAHTRVHTMDKVQVAYQRRPEEPLSPQDSIPILYEDDDLLVVNKPGDLLSHPTDKIVDHTVLGLLRHSRPDLPKLHLLHRLDRETSGVIALAKHAKAARAWTRQMEGHDIQKEYLAVVRGTVTPAEGEIRLPIGRQGGAIRVRQWVNTQGAVSAITRYRVINSAGGMSNRTAAVGDGGCREGRLSGEAVIGSLYIKSPLAAVPDSRHFRQPPSPTAAVPSPISILRVFPKTGRLHQIRVHFAAIGHPLLGDPLYNGQGEVYQKMIAGTCTDADRAGLGFPRVALHAAALTLIHPSTGKSLRVEAPLPPDIEALVGVFRG